MLGAPLSCWATSLLDTCSLFDKPESASLQVPPVVLDKEKAATKQGEARQVVTPRPGNPNLQLLGRSLNDPEDLNTSHVGAGPWGSHAFLVWGFLEITKKGYGCSLNPGAHLRT